VKNAEGVDSPATCRRDQVRRAARWLREAGVQVPEKNGEPAAAIEISPLCATNSAQLKTRKSFARLGRIEEEAAVYIEA
jgi:hypothetical protein